MFVEGVYDLLIVTELGCGVGLALGALAEEVYGGDAARAVQVPDRGYRLLQRVARDVAARDPAHHGPRDDGHGVGYCLVKDPHTKNSHLLRSVATLLGFY